MSPSFQPFVDDVHDCVWPEVLVGRSDADGVLQAGDRVLTPCRTCGVAPLEALNTLGVVAEETGRAFAKLAMDRSMLLFHWSPAARRKQINRHGLLPKRRPTVSLGNVDGRVWKPPYICFGDTPAWAWALSGGMRHTPSGEWDLWQTYADKLTDPMILSTTVANGIHEIRTDHRVFKRDLWHVGTRVKP
jgi:hypothetical protein